MHTLVPNPRFTHVDCSRCERSVPPSDLMTLCECGAPLLARYDLSALAAIDDAAPGLWRYHELLPYDGRDAYLGEGGTPLLRAPGLSARLGLENLWVKDESRNPTGSFKDRGLALAVGMAKLGGAAGVVVPSAGNAGAAMAVYAARLGMRASVVMPSDVPSSVVEIARRAGAEVELVDALIDGAGAIAQEIENAEGFMNVATLAEPFRVEGKKTMGFELVEQLGDVPDVVVYPLGGGTGIVGMDKGFDELEAIGLIGDRRPRMIAVQAEGCAPVVRAFSQGHEAAEPWEEASTNAPGLRVPKLRGDRLVLAALRRTGGLAVPVSDAAAESWGEKAAHFDGVLMGPESACALAGLVSLVERGLVRPHETVVLFHTGAPYGAEGTQPQAAALTDVTRSEREPA